LSIGIIQAIQPSTSLRVRDSPVECQPSRTTRCYVATGKPPGLAPLRQSGHVLFMYKIIGVDQKEYGPITADQLRLWISEGRINAATKVQVIGEAEWKFMAQLPEFASILPRSAPPLGVSPISIAPVQKTSQMAVWALIIGILGVLPCCGFVVPSLVSIVLGGIALSRLSSHPELRGRGLAIAGIILGVIGLLVGITLGVLFITNPGLFPSLPNGFSSPQ
jgi:hypothetical protein